MDEYHPQEDDRMTQSRRMSLDSEDDMTDLLSSASPPGRLKRSRNTNTRLPHPIHTPSSPTSSTIPPSLLASAPTSPPTPAPSPTPTQRAPDWRTAAEHENANFSNIRMLFTDMGDPEKQRLLAELLNMCNSKQLVFVHEFVSPLLKKDPFTTLPDELCIKILTSVDYHTLSQCERVSRRWRQLAKDEELWKLQNEKRGYLDRQASHPNRTTTPSSSLFPFPMSSMPNMSSSARRPGPQDHVQDDPVPSPSMVLAGGNTRPGPAHMQSAPTQAPAQTQALPGQQVSGSGFGHTSTTPSGPDLRTQSLDRNRGSRSLRRRPKAMSYRSHFKQRYLVEQAWRTGGKCDHRQITPDQGVVTSLHLTEKYIVVALDNAKIHVFDTDGAHQKTLQGHVMGVWAMIPWDNILVSGGCDRDVRVWNMATGASIHVLRGHTSTVRCLKMADSTTAISGSRDTTLRIWDIAKGVCKHVLVGHQASVRCLEIHGDLIVSGSYDTTARIWSISEGRCLRTLTGHFSQIYAIAFDGKRVATGSLDTSVRIWDPYDGKCLHVLQGHTSLVGQLQMRGDILVTGGSDGSVRVWSLTEFQAIHRLAAHDNSVTSLQFDDNRIVSGGSDGRVKVWDLKTGTLVRELTKPTEAVWRVAFEDEKAVIMACRNSKTFMEVSQASGRSLGPFH
ncbi:WD40 repeat-like protein [Eremomyces bilateralis CBS 781.70]|uniref:WD40 repeat-like protein n=1 Tax=Eremomyces bilateralis CBS 781.70 TaxID=1392243 RepID=A0A6G1G3N7_9PEZI|nr:WD40 repeat-like protein [Eremomyces bilateralis CBS 781.70]KAF1812715.1 WD40 repeat-like protein [Eremomyces bilateralis CBS 781.70]